MKTATIPEVEFAAPPPLANEIVVAPPANLPAEQPQGDTMLNLIERAARDPNVDIDKMERLIAMQERMQGKAAEHEYVNAMADAQAGMRAVRTDASNPQTKSKYASYHALDTAIRPVYTANGFSLSFDTGETPAVDTVRILCNVAHRGGHQKQHHIDMPSDGKGARGNDVMTKTHATGSAVTYGRRYLLGMIFNITIGNDDDGNAAGHRPGAPGSAGGGTQFRPEKRSGLQEAHDEIVELTGNATSQYQVDKLKKAIAANWVVTNTTEKGKISQVSQYLDLARNPDDVAKILNGNVAVIEGAGEAKSTEINEDAERLLAFFEKEARGGNAQ